MGLDLIPLADIAGGGIRVLPVVLRPEALLPVATNFLAARPLVSSVANVAGELVELLGDDIKLLDRVCRLIVLPDRIKPLVASCTFEAVTELVARP